MKWLQTSNIPSGLTSTQYHYYEYKSRRRAGATVKHTLQVNTGWKVKGQEQHHHKVHLQEIEKQLITRGA